MATAIQTTAFVVDSPTSFAPPLVSSPMVQLILARIKPNIAAFTSDDGLRIAAGIGFKF